MKKLNKVIALLLAATMLFALTGCKSGDYKKAEALLASGDPRGAYDIFTALVDYKDSPARADEALMAMANDAYAEKNYDAVIELCDILGSHPGAEALLADAQYGKACSLMDGGSFEQAKELFTLLGAYKDSANKITACDYQLALALFDAGKFEEAGAAFAVLGEYEDAADKIPECDYQHALKLLADGNFLEAEAAFTALGDYSDAAAQISECRYQQAVKLYNEGSFEAATQLFMALPLYKDADHYAVLGMLQYDPNGFIDIMAAGTQVYLQLLGTSYQLQESTVTYERDTREFHVDGDGINRQTYLVFLPVNAEGVTHNKGQINNIMVRGIAWSVNDCEPTLNATLLTSVAVTAALDDASAQDPVALAALVTSSFTDLMMAGPKLDQVPESGYRANVDIPFDNYQLTASILYYPDVYQFTFTITVPELVK